MIKQILDRIYPGDLYCICCGKIIDESRTFGLCDECMKSIKWNNGRTCEKCGRRLSKNNERNICFNCLEHSHKFRKGYSCSEYGTHERYVAMRFKYGDKLFIGEKLGEMLANCMQAALGTDVLPFAYDLLVPVPLYHEKELARGYNQSEIAAAHFAQISHLEVRNLKTKFGIPNIQEPVKRICETKPMKGLNPTERRENIRNSFAIKEEFKDEIKGANCLIIDDIYTTGATVDEIAGILYENGANSVDFLSFASGPDVI